MSEKEDLSNTLETLLEKFEILPYENWKKRLMVHHYEPKLGQENKSSTFKRIRESIGKKQDGEETKGLYVYKKSKKTLYVGEGKLIKRIESHYNESCAPPETRGRTRRSKKWYAFFSKHRGKLTVYWRECADTELRKTYERMLAFVLKPEFIGEK